MTQRERRGDPRYKINQMIGYFPNREEYLWAEGVDICRSGLACVSKHPIAPLTNLFMMLGVPGPGGESLVRCEGYVTHSHMEEGYCHFGVRIQKVDEDDNGVFQAYLNTLDECQQAG